MEELLLGPLAPGQELDVIEDERVDAAELLLEFAHLVAPHRADQLVHENSRRHEEDLAQTLAARGIDLVPDRGHEVRFTEAHPAVDEERVVFFPRLVRDRLRRRMRELVARANRSEEHTSELQSRQYLVCRLLLE